LCVTTPPSCVITPSSNSAEATIPRKKTSAPTATIETTDFLDGLGLTTRIVGLLRDAGLTTRESIHEASLKAAAGIGQAIAAKVLAALPVDREPAPVAAEPEPSSPVVVSDQPESQRSDVATGSGAEADVITDDVAIRDMEPERDHPGEAGAEEVEDDGDLETSLLRADEPIATDSEDLLFGGASRPSPLPERPVAEGPPVVVPVFGGHLLIERLADDRRRVLCEDPWLRDRFEEACGSINVSLDADGHAVLPYETCRLLVAGLKDPSVRKELRTWNQPVVRPPSLVTAHGRIGVTVFMSAGGPIAAVKPLENDGRIENRMDLVCPALGGRWSDEKSTWSIPEARLQDLARAMDMLPAGAPPAPAEVRRAAAADRRPAAAEKDGLAYAIGDDGKADKDWYRRAGRRDDVEVLGGIVHIYHVDDRTWLAAKHDGDGAVNAAIKDAVARISGYQGYHGPLNGHKFPASDAPRIVAELRRIDAAGRPAQLL
jgi:hypothetical protein